MAIYAVIVVMVSATLLDIVLANRLLATGGLIPTVASLLLRTLRLGHSIRMLGLHLKSNAVLCEPGCAGPSQFLTLAAIVAARRAACRAAAAHQVAESRIGVICDGRADIVDGADAALHNIARRIRGNTDRVTRKL